MSNGNAGGETEIAISGGSNIKKCNELECVQESGKKLLNNLYFLAVQAFSNRY